MRVRLYEARAIASGASGRNGGFALRGGAMHYDVARATFGPERAAAFWRLTERTLDRMAELAGDAFRRVGSLRLAADEQERDELRAEHDALLADGFAVEWVDELPERLAGTYHAAIVNPDDGALFPGRWVRRLASGAVEAGADVREGTRVTSLDELDAEQVVIASDGYRSGLVGELDDIVRPTRGQVVATEPLPELLYGRPHYARYGFDYWQQLPDGRLVAGGRRDVTLEAEFTAAGRRRRSPSRSRSSRWYATSSATSPRSRIAGPESSGRRPTTCRSWARSPGVRASGSPAATRATETCSGSLPVTSSRRRSSAGTSPSSSCSILRACSSPLPAPARSRRSATSRMRCPRCPSRARTSPCRGRGSSLPRNRRAPAPSRVPRRDPRPRSRR